METVSFFSDATREELPAQLEAGVPHPHLIPAIRRGRLPTAFSAEALLVLPDFSGQEDPETVGAVLLDFYRGLSSLAQGRPLFVCAPDPGEQGDVSSADRGIRFLLERPALLRAFLRAALCASPCGRILPVIPFVSSCGEIGAVRRLTEETMRALLAEDQIFDETMEWGIAIGTPSGVLQSAELCREVDFLMVDLDALYCHTFAHPCPAAGKLSQEEAEVLAFLLSFSAENAHKAGRYIAVFGWKTDIPVDRFFAQNADFLILPQEKLRKIRHLLRRNP